MSLVRRRWIISAAMEMAISLGVLRLDGNANRQVQLVDLLLRKALLLRAGAHKGRLAARAQQPR